MTTDKTLKNILDLQEKMDKLPQLSAREAEAFDTGNMISSVFYSNLLEGNTLSREEAIKAMFEKGNNGINKQ